MDADVASVLKSKNILLWKAMLSAVGYPDLKVVAEFQQGSELVGNVERTGLWPAKFQPAVMNVSELHRVAAMERNGLQQQFSGQVAHAEEVWSKTMDEVAIGTLLSLIPLNEVDVSWPLSRRFGLLQGQKIRCINDFSRSAVNSCVQTCESPKPHTLDVFGALCIQTMDITGRFNRWKGRTFHLVGAWRQCAVHPDSKKFAHIAVQNPQTKEVVAFRMKAFPFGAVRSVNLFLRTSYSLWFLLVKELLILATNYLIILSCLLRTPR